MKKLLLLLGSATLCASGASTTVSCFWSKPSEEEETKQNLYTAIKNKDLGEIKNDEESTIFTSLKELNPELEVDDIEIINISSTGAKVKAIESSKLYFGDAQLTFTIEDYIPDGRQELVDVIANSYLGELDNNQESTIKAVVEEQNKNIDMSQINITNITTTSAKLTAKADSTSYRGSVTVTFKIKEVVVKKELIEVITQPALGRLENNDQNTISNAVKQKNPSVDMSQITISNITTTSAKLTAKADSKDYQGSTTVTFTLNDAILKKELTEVITKPALGRLENNDQNTISNAVEKNNPSVDMNQITISNITTTSAKLTANTNSKDYQGTTTVTFNLDGSSINKEDKTLVGYWYEWGGSYQVKPNLTELPSSYNVIDLSFLYATAPYQMPVFQVNDPVSLKTGITYQHSLGHKVLVSMGGQTGDSMKFRKGQEAELKAAILKAINDYDLDGLDIDWEGSCLADRESQEVTITVLKEIKDEWKAQGKNFIITMAPEMPYLKNSSLNSGASYIPFLKGLDDYYDWINPQFYNGWAFGPYVEQAEANKLGVNPLEIITNDDEARRGEFYYVMTKYLTTTYSRYNDFYLIEPERFVLGASTNEPAGRGAATETAIKKSYKLLAEDGIYTRGLMTWALNFDNYDGNIISNNQTIYFKRWSFAKWYDETHGTEFD
ncbi:chitinase [Spiroplasma sabaudiense Ar-1343]|uniref:chitinase n=1 Tax=Spiroplasma sabaudiense Ar-1343 TaxID=1276257 RepID=W6AAT6_9MOLU|nr:glycosyl hydrolase family 18 protein [Spiroplasma sabaudiense]AHI54273.1 chitinase [Spiroplasma sabaudiense Ar-1343]